MNVHRLVFVTDPMCSWCWGMADEIRTARRELAGQAEFDLLLGGINTHGTQPVGEYGRRFLMKLWREVQDTTGQAFGFQLPEQYVHNSTLACLAVEVVREATSTVPFEYLHAVQEQFFQFGRNISDLEVLAELAQPFAVSEERMKHGVQDPAIRERVRFQFEHAGRFGTNALPSLLIEGDGKLRLLAGGYLDASMLMEMLPG